MFLGNGKCDNNDSTFHLWNTVLIFELKIKIKFTYHFYGTCTQEKTHFVISFLC